MLLSSEWIVNQRLVHYEPPKFLAITDHWTAFAIFNSSISFMLIHMHRSLRTVALVGGLLAWLMATGCDTTGDALLPTADSGPSGGHPIGTSASPRATIEQMVRNYQQLHSYQDEAYVRLLYDLDGKRLEDRAPLSIAWDDRGRLGLRVYSVQAGPSTDPSSGRWRLRLPEAEAIVPQQVLSRAIPPRVDFAWLLGDPLVAERLSAGLAGFPPQLDLLLAPKPLKGLIDDKVALSFSHPETVDGRTCLVIRVERGAAEFMLWIDQEKLLLRRLRLPRSHLTPTMLQDGRISNVDLTIEFAGARGNENTDWTSFEVASQPEELRVSRFVPAPLPIDTSGLGEQVPGFHLESPTGETVYSSDKVSPHRKATVLVWLADHPTCRMACEQMQRVRESLPALGLPEGAVEFVMVWAEPQPPAGSTFETLAKQWKLPGILALDREAMGRDLFNVQEAPTLVVVDHQNRLQLRESRSNPLLDQVLPQLLLRVSNGENLADELVQKQIQLAQRHRAELRMAAAIDARPTGDPFTGRPYPPETFALRELARSPSKGIAIAADSDEQGSMWTLYNTGQLRQDTASTLALPDANATQWLDTRWRNEASDTGRIEVSPASNFVAYNSHGDTAIQWIDCETKENRTIELDVAGRLIDMRWLPRREGSKARLAVITSEGQTLLIDPTDRQQLSGYSSVKPLALLPGSPSDSSIAGYVVLADRSIQPLQLSATAGVAASDSVQQLLAFQPKQGPWMVGNERERTWTLARGWLAADEPALFLLDEQRKQHWHYRMPLEPGPSPTACSVAIDPTTGQVLWAVLSGTQTIHLLRADGRIIDHFRTAEPVVGLSLQPNGARIELTVVHAGQAVRYAIDWNAVGEVK